MKCAVIHNLAIIEIHVQWGVLAATRVARSPREDTVDYLHNSRERVVGVGGPAPGGRGVHNSSQHLRYVGYHASYGGI
jgi:hypothetical protein